MTVDLLILAIADGISYASLLFLVALGLTLIFGVLQILNVAHGSLYAFGGYLAATFSAAALTHEASTGTLLACLVGAGLLVGLVMGAILEIGLLRRVQGRDPIVQLLITFAAFMIFEDVQRLIWGAQPTSAPEIVARFGTVDVAGGTFTRYQLLFIPCVALGIYALLLFFLKRTRLGKQVVAVTHNREVATAIGINARRIGYLTFTVGAMLGALGGALTAPTTSLLPGVGTEMIVLSFAVVATAGMGQISGALVAALLIGLARSVALYTFPEFEVVVPYLIMVAVLLVRPNGLFTIAQARKI